MRNNGLKEALKVRFIREIDPALLNEIGISKTRLNRIIDNTEETMWAGPINSIEIKKICQALHLAWDWETEKFVTLEIALKKV